MFFAYILKSLKDGKYYYGHTNTLDERIKRHNNGREKSTKSRRPFLLHYFEQFETMEEAADREYFFKSISGYVYLKGKGII
ncbi:MAG: GIY-YIG nuclease family protein [Bacteroidetes bacterium]|nr:GIY-YIG nuclease family protein [Bacteroidota bacterium]